jgi:acyl-CoA reductase-like NAD-dependent aldehyde dehydrogenase
MTISVFRERDQAVGSPELARQMGPLTSAEQHEKVLGYVSCGLDVGARAPIGGGRVGDRGYFVEPTVLTDTTPDMKVVREEIFGPVVCAIPFHFERDEVIKSGNATNFGLASGIWTRDINKAHRTANRLRAGTVWINCYSVFDAAMPFGGYMESAGAGDGPQRARELPRNQVRGRPARIADRPCNGRGPSGPRPFITYQREAHHESRRRS